MAEEFDKTKTCKGCPDRCPEPNCHTNCMGYIQKHAETRKQKEARQKALELNRYFDASAARIKSRWIKGVQKGYKKR